MLLEFVEAPCLEALEDLGVCSLGLTVAARVSNRGVVDRRAEVGAVELEQATGELRAIVSDDAVGYAEAANQALDNFTTDRAGMSRTGSTSAHLVNLSMAT